MSTYERPLTIEDMQAIGAARGVRCLLAEYVSRHTPFERECAPMQCWWTTAIDAKHGTWCGACAKEAEYGTQADMQRLAYEWGGWCLSMEYANVNTHQEWECVEGQQDDALQDQLTTSLHTSAFKDGASDRPVEACDAWSKIIVRNARNQKGGLAPIASLIGFSYTSAKRSTDD